MELEVDTKSTLSHVLYRWQSCYNAWDQYCAATKRDNFADSILGRALSSVEERIANSYDIYVDDLGKRFAEGDGKCFRFTDLTRVSRLDILLISEYQNVLRRI